MDNTKEENNKNQKEIKEGFFNTSMIRFIIVGVINTLISTSIMFVLHKWLDYWPSTFIAFVAGSICSFFLNKNFTFKSSGNGMKTLLRFIISLGVCYFVVYFLAHRLTLFFLGQLDLGIEKNTMEKWAMLVAQVIFPAFNYLGQRFFVFKKA